MLLAVLTFSPIRVILGKRRCKAMSKAILFDLDGTLTDSGEGIINSAEYALKHFGLPIPDRETMRVFVGPPLRDTFAHFGIPTDRLDEAVAVYRERYIPIGIYENKPYPGVDTLLSRLRQQGHRLFIATSKPEWMAVDVLTRFGLSSYFEIIAGATMDGSRDTKEDVISYLLNQVGDLSEAVMVGDTAFDVIGAAAHHIPCIGVSWGYGKVSDMTEAGVAAIAHTTEELYKLLNSKKAC